MLPELGPRLKLGLEHLAKLLRTGQSRRNCLVWRESYNCFSVLIDSGNSEYQQYGSLHCSVNASEPLEHYQLIPWLRFI